MFTLNAFGLQGCASCQLCGYTYGQPGQPAISNKPLRKVDGRGPTPSPIFLLGEGPGEEENRTGKPFVGLSGQYLQLQIDSLGLGPYIRIGNVVRCRPPGNRKPRPEEMEACSPWLRLELEETQPQVIVALGGTAISWFLPKMKLKGKVGDYVGKDFGKYADGGHIHHAGVAVIGSYHPAALSPVQRATIRGVLEQAAEMVGIQIERAPEEVVDYAVEAW